MTETIDIAEKMRLEILEGNIRIVEFMGGVWEINWSGAEGYRFSKEDMEHHRWGSGIAFLYKSSLGYDHNWNHLMAVACKIKHTIPEPTEEYEKNLYNIIFESIIPDFNCQLTFMAIDYFLKYRSESQQTK